MSWKWLLRLAFVPVVARAASPALAAAEPEPVICVSGPQWRPTLEDIRRIEAVPIPQGYRALFESTQPCTRWALNKEALVDLHLRFGSEGSAAAALAYLEQDYTRQASLERYLSLLRAAMAAALPDLRRAAAMEQPPGLHYSVRYRFMDASAPIRRLRELLYVGEQYLFVAEQHLHAAEEFRSLPLLDKAEAYLGKVIETQSLVGTLDHGLADLLSFNPQGFQIDDARRRSALLRARITGRSDDLDRAVAAVRGEEGPLYRRIAEEAFSGGNDFCDISRGAGDAERLEAACNDLDNAQERLVSYWVDRAVLDLLVSAGGPPRGSGAPAQAAEPDPFGWPGSYAFAMRLLEHEAAGGSPRCCGMAGREDRLRLFLANADYHARRLALLAPSGARCSCEREWREALDSLRWAEALAPPHEAAGRFRRIATEWLRLWRMAAALFPSSEDRRYPVETTADQLFAEYLQVNLRGLDPAAAAPTTPH